MLFIQALFTCCNLSATLTRLTIGIEHAVNTRAEQEEKPFERRLTGKTDLQTESDQEEQ